MNLKINLADITDNKEMIKAHLIKKALYENNTLKVLDGILAIRNQDCFWIPIQMEKIFSVICVRISLAKMLIMCLEQKH